MSVEQFYVCDMKGCTSRRPFTDAAGWVHIERDDARWVPMGCPPIGGDFCNRLHAAWHLMGATSSDEIARPER